MKNRFKKLAILALSTVCLLANGATYGMDRKTTSEENPEKSLSISTFGSSSLEMSQLQQSFIQEVSQLSESQMMMMSQFMSNMRQGRDLSASSLDFAAMLYKQEFERLNNTIKSPLWPGNTHPAKMCDALGALSLTYVPVVSFYKDCGGTEALQALYALGKNLDPISSGHLTQFLMSLSADDINLINNPSYMITFLKMLKPLNLLPCMQVFAESGINDWHLQNHLQQLVSFQSSQPMFMSCMGMKQGSFLVKMASYYDSLIQPIQTIYIGQGDAQSQQNLRGKLVTCITEQFNQAFYINGKPWFNIIEQGEWFDLQFTKWLNILSILPKYTVQNWEIKGQKLDDLLEQVEWANKTLDSSLTNNKKYSGAPISPYKVSLTQTSKPEKAEDVDFLKSVINEHVDSHKDEISAWDKVKGIMPMLKKVVQLVDDFGDVVSKKGRIS